MSSLVTRIDKNKIWPIFGGIHPPEKKVLSNQTKSQSLPLFEEYCVPLEQHRGDSGAPCVSIGDHVRLGQALTKVSGDQDLPTHAPTSGLVTAFIQQPQTHPSGLPIWSCVIQADGKDTVYDEYPCPTLEGLQPHRLAQLLQEAGVCGLGGAGYPSHLKVEAYQTTEVLIINGVECEPYITADDCLMQENTQSLMQGIEIIQRVVQAQRILVAIEDNKPKAIAAVQDAIKLSSLEAPLLQLRIVPTKYPSGGEKQLVELLTGIQVPKGGYLADIGALMFNVGTMVAMSNAVLKGQPLTERIVTITGESIKNPGNYRIRIGTKIKDVLQHLGLKNHPQQKVIVGGPMMGFTLPSLESSIIKSTNCLLLPAVDELLSSEVERDCIRCGDCAEVCPIELQPQQLFWFAQAGEHKKSIEHHLFDCIECGCCSYVCPSNIPLVHHYRIEKAKIRVQTQEEHAAKIAREKFEQRNLRLKQQKAARKARQLSQTTSQKASMSQENKDLIAAAMARAKAKQNAEPEQAKALQTTSQTSENPPTQPDPKKAAVAAAIARAKAKKSGEPEPDSVTQKESPESEQTKSSQDPKKAAVAAAIARAKAKKAQQNKIKKENSDTPEDN